MRGRWNSDKESVRLKSEARRAREHAEAQAREAVLARENALQAKLAEKSQGQEARGIEYLLEEAAKRDPSLYAILKVVAERAPRILAAEYGRALQHMAKLPFLRDPSTWEPRGKGRETLFRSLCEHVFAQFPMPAFLWSAFFEQDVDDLSLFVAHVAMGGSVYAGVKGGLLPVPLTRQMCHDLMQTPSDIGFFSALRRVEIRAYGGGPRLFAAWMASQAGRRLHSAADEAFWVTVIDWFAKNPMLDPNQVGPLVDYILYRRRQDASFSMKGRSALAMIRTMEEWHGQLAKAKAIHGAAYKPTGFHSYKTTKTARTQSGNHIEEIWTVEEILTSKALLEEGRVLKHCVSSYGYSIERGFTSIWSLQVNSERTVTIEVRNDIRRVVQVRGKLNRTSTAREFQVVNEWAKLNGLEISLGRW